ncbi:MAG TPA: heme exporter protein CcmB [Kofleriaceae bacterium]|jgi:heme exporter protein CcmB
MSMLGHAVRVAAKDLRIELRSKEILYTMAFFGALIVVIDAFVFPSNKPDVVRLAAPGMLWVAMAFAGTIGLGRAFDRERENDTMRALLLAPIPRLSVFLGKAMATTMMIIAVAVVCVPLLALFLQADLFASPLILVGAIVGGAIGFSIVGSVFAAMLLKVRSRDVLLPVILYPILIPLFAAGTSATSALLREGSPDWDKATFWLGFLGIYDAAALVLSFWIYEDLVIE